MAFRIRISVRGVLIEEGRVLLTEYHDSTGVWFVIPGGGVNHNELLREALVREFAEESGLLIEPTGLLFEREVVADRQDNCFLQSGFHQVELFYQVVRRGLAEGGAANPDPCQIGVRWVPLDDLAELRIYPSDLGIRLEAAGLG